MRLCAQKVGSPCEIFSNASGSARLMCLRRSSALLGISILASVDLDAPPELLVLIAHELDHVGVHLNLLIHANRERFRVGLRVVNRHVELETPEAGAPV